MTKLEIFTELNELATTHGASDDVKAFIEKEYDSLVAKHDESIEKYNAITGMIMEVLEGASKPMLSKEVAEKVEGFNAGQVNYYLNKLAKEGKVVKNHNGKMNEYTKA